MSITTGWWARMGPWPSSCGSTAWSPGAQMDPSDEQVRLSLVRRQVHRSFQLRHRLAILLPLVQKLGIDMIWFCTLVAVCLQTAWLSPPVALSAYFLKGVVPEWKLSDIYAGMMQFMVLQMIGLGLVLLFPQLALWLPAALRN